MNSIINFIWKIISMGVAALLGNIVGALLHTRLTGNEINGLTSRFTTESGRTYSNFPVLTNFYPALLFGLLGRPRWLFAFVGGVLSSAILGHQLEPPVVERIVAFTTRARQADDQTKQLEV